MERRRLGRTDMVVSALGFGGAEIGVGTSQAEVTRVLDAALDAGLNVIDTAECYRDSEQLIGAATATRRSDFYLFGKCGHAQDLDGHDWDPEMMTRGIERTLQRLRTDHLDLLQLHSCDEALLRQGDVIDVLRRAREAGKTRYIGYSGDGDAALFAVTCGVFDTLQTSINIADQEALDRTLPEAGRRGVGVIAKRPLANVAWRTGSKPASAYHHTYWERLGVLRYPFVEQALAAVRNGGGDSALDESVAIALRFTLACAPVATAIVGTRNPGRWAANAQLLQAGALPEQDFAAIRRRWKEVAGPDWRGQT